MPGHRGHRPGVAVGSDVDPTLTGARIVLKPNVACGRCVNCVAGRTNACERLTWIGGTLPVGRERSPTTSWLQRNVWNVPDDVDDATAALVECLATPVHAVRLAGDLTGARVAVVGAGTIGLLCLVAALQAGAGTVVVTDLEPSKLDRALRVGATAGIRADEPDLTAIVHAALGGPADVVLDCVTGQARWRSRWRCCAGPARCWSWACRPRPLEVDMPTVQDHEIRVQGCAAYTGEDFVTAISLAASGAVPVAELVDTVSSLDEVEDAFARAARPDCGKVLIGLDAAPVV